MADTFSVSSQAASYTSESLRPSRHPSTAGRGPLQASTHENMAHGYVTGAQSTELPRPTAEDAQEPKLSSTGERSNKPNAAAQPLHPKLWKPVYLERRRLVIFPILFLGSIVVIQVLIHVSQSNNGLATPSKNLHYLWTFGPMATLTLIAAFWTRVEFQLKSIAPWAHMFDGERADKTLLLDYLSMLQPVVVVRAVKLRDWVVASASLCSLILRVTIIFSTALIALTQTEVHDANVPVALRSSFVDSAAKLGDVATKLGTLPYYSMRGLSERDMPFPDGTWNNYAFQQFDLTKVSDARLNVRVEGFTSNLSCEPASLNISYSNCSDDVTGFCWALETKQCQYPIRRIPSSRDLPRLDDAKPSYHGKINLSGCNNSTKVEDIALYMMFGRFKSDNGTDDADSDTFSHSAQIVCQASYAIEPVDVVSNHTRVISVSKSGTGPSRQIEELAEGRMPYLYLSSWDTATSTSLVDVIVHLSGEAGEPEDAEMDIYFSDVLAFSRGGNSSAADLLKETFLADALSRHYQQATAFIGRSVFSTQAAGNITGTMDLKLERLLVSAATGHTMTALLSVTTLLSILVIFTRPGLSTLPKNPNNVIETAQLLANSKDVLNLLVGAGPASLGTMMNRLRDFQFRINKTTTTVPPGSPNELVQISASSNQEPHNELHYLNAPAKTMKAPLVLSPISIFGVQILIVGTIVALGTILRVSGDKKDFVDVSDWQYLHFAWTIVPALFLSLISMYFGAVDSEIRSLTPYSKLSKGASLAQMINLDLLDGSTPRLLWREYRSESFAALPSTLCVLASSLLTIFVGSLYSVVTLPIDTAIQLQTESSFNVQMAVPSSSEVRGQLPDFSSLTSSLILESNLSYPSFTYEALAFPEFSIINASQNLHISPSDVINATLPALRSKLSCTRYGSSEIQMEVVSAPIPGVPASHQANRETLAINIDGEQHSSRTIPNGLTHNVELPLNSRPDADWIFGIGDSCKGTSQPLWCTSDFLYVWGRKTNSTSQAGNHVAALTCNESIEAVDVFTTFLGPQLTIDPSFPPRPINDSARKSTVDVHMGNAWDTDNWLSPYHYLAAGVAAPGTYLWPFFDALTTSRYAIPLRDLDDPARDEAVARAVVAQHGILRAQVLSEGFRGPADATNATLANPPASVEAANDAVAYAGTLRSSSGSSGRRRLAQDPATTRVLEALLAATLVLAVAARLLMRNTKLLPRSPTSVASVAALVADGNVAAVLPENAQLLSDEEILAAVGGGYLLRLGWWTSTPGDAPSQRFGIFAVKTSKESVFDWL